MSIIFYIIRTLIIIILVSGLTALIRKGSSETTDECIEDEYTILRLPKIYFWIGVIAAVIFAAIIIICLITNVNKIFDFMVLTLFILISVILSVAEIFWKIEFNRKEDFFDYTTSFGRKHKIYYKDITYLNTSNDRLVFKANKKTFTIYSYTNNYKKFLKNIQVRTNKKIMKANDQKVCAMKRALKQVRDPIGFIVAMCIISGSCFFIAGLFIYGLCTHSFPDGQEIGFIIFVLIVLIIAVGYPFLFAFAVNNRKKYPRLARAMVKRGYFIDE